ncbi:MAG TPA: uroporphyrinogen-III synthase [Acidimicrobiales bacterium]|nr:uroporphyrinogen-III synthase [Acidimicrobiales bacterium]
MRTRPTTTGPLTGFTIGVTACRRADEQIELLERKGATTVHGPAIQTFPLIAEAELAEATRAVVADPPDYTLLSTGIGVRAWFEAAESLDLADALLDALGRSTIIARGPKAHGAAVTNGLDVRWQAPNGWASEMLDHLREIGVEGARVAVQLDGASGAPLAKAVGQIGAVPLAVPVYEWTMPTDSTAAERLVEAMVEGRVDGVTFTARPQVENLATIAERMGLLDRLLAALSGRVVPICVGPVCASGITDLGLPEPVQPGRQRLGSMVLAVADTFRSLGRDLTLAGIDVRLQGRAVVLPPDLAAGDASTTVLLTDRERVVLHALAERPGVVWSKDDLLARVWNGAESDPHVVEVTVGRLRQRLGPAGAGVETVMRRGYRLTDR